MATCFGKNRRKPGSVDLLGFALHVIHQEVLPESVRRSEIGFAAAHFGDFLDEVDEAIVAGEHERIDHNAGALALIDFFERLADHEGVQTESIFVDAPVFERKGGWLSVRDHDDLTHVFLLAEQNALGEAKAFARIGVKRANLDAGEFAEGNLFRAVVKQDEAQGIAGILRANKMRERHGHALRGSETVLAIENHAVAAIEQNDCGAGAVIFALVNHEVGVRHVDGNLRALAPHGVEESFAYVEIHGVAEFVGTRDAAGLDAGREVTRVVTAEDAAAQRAQKILQGFEAEKIDGFVSNLESCLGLALVRLAELPTRGSLRGRRDLRWLLRIDEAFLRETFHEFVEQVFYGLIVLRVRILQHFAKL